MLQPSLGAVAAVLSILRQAVTRLSLGFLGRIMRPSCLKPVDPLVVHFPALPLKKHMQAAVAVAYPCLGQVMVFAIHEYFIRMIDSDMLETALF